MSKCYLLFIPPDLIHSYISHAISRFTLHHAAQYLQEDDRILPVRLGEKIRFSLLNTKLFPLIATQAQ